MANATTYKTSESGMYRVTIATAHMHAGFVYKPGADAIVVNQEILDDMIAAGVVTSVAAA
jgi:hypothetical protein